MDNLDEQSKGLLFEKLMSAARFGQFSVIEQVLDEASDLVNRANDQGATPLMVAAYNALPDTMSLLLKRGASVDARDARGDTALHWAATAWEQMAEDAIIVLIDHGARVDAMNDNGETPLFKCMTKGKDGDVDELDYDQSDAVWALVSHGANINVFDSFGVNALDLLLSTQDRFTADVFQKLRAMIEDGVMQDNTLTPKSIQSPRRL